MAGNLRLRLLLEADAAAFKRGIADARKSLASLGDKAVESSNKLRQALQGGGQQLRSLGTTLTASVTVPMAGLAGTVIHTAAEFEAAMNSVKALSLDAPREQIEALEAQARKLGETTKFSATESAQAIEILLRNGLDTETILGGALEASLDLAAATGASLPRAADVITDAMAQFRLEAGDLDQVVTQIVGTVNSSKFAFEDYAHALAQGGGAAGAVIEFEEFNAAIAAIAPNFQSGSDAGTAFKTFITSLALDTKSAREAAHELGITFVDAAGEIRPMQEIVTELTAKFGELSEEQKLLAGTDIFGQDALRALLGLVQTGSEDFKSLGNQIASVDVKLQQATRQQGFSAELTKLKSAMEGLAISVGDSGILELATDIVEGITSVVRAFGELDPATKRIIAIVGGGAAAAGPLLLGLGALAAAMAAIATPVGIVVAALVGVGSLAAALYANRDAVEEALLGAIDTLQAKFESAVEWVASLGQAFTDLKDDVVDAASGMVSDVTGFFGDKLAAAADLATSAADRVSDAFRDLEDDVTGNSYVPDMVDAIGQHFGRLGKEMVEPGEEATRSLSNAFDGLGRDVASSIGGMIRDGEASLSSFADFVDRIAQRILDSLIETAVVQPLSQGIGSIFGSAIGTAFGGGAAGASASYIPPGFAAGGAFDDRGVIPFARGGVVSAPTIFPFARGTGLMGEAGPEAILPLKRLPGGDLGVRAEVGSAAGGGAEPRVEINIIDQRQGTAPPIEASESRGPDGMRVVRIMVRDQVRSSIASGEVDGEMSRRFGLRPTAR